METPTKKRKRHPEDKWDRPVNVNAECDLIKVIKEKKIIFVFLIEKKRKISLIYKQKF